jgi:hypothetical protein
MERMVNDEGEKRGTNYSFHYSDFLDGSRNALSD